MHFESAVEGQEHQQYRKALEWPQSGRRISSRIAGN